MEKKCTTCKETKLIDEFNKNKSKKDGYNTICRVCSNARSKKYYQENKEHHKEVIGERKKRIALENRRKIFEYLKDNPCVDCGNDNPIVLEFDHRDDVEKVTEVSKMVRERKWDATMEEVGKCDVRCSNCHKIRTAEQLGWYQGLI